MRLLADTNIVYWTLAHPDKLSREISGLLQSGDHDLYVSSLSIAEMRIKEAIGKFVPPEHLLELIEASQFTKLAFSGLHADRLRGLPLHHRDPFDRMLIAQAIEEGMSILTSDEQFGRYPVHVIRN